MSNNRRTPHPAPSPWRSVDEAARKRAERAAAKRRRLMIVEGGYAEINGNVVSLSSVYREPD